MVRDILGGDFAGLIRIDRCNIVDELLVDCGSAVGLFGSVGNDIDMVTGELTGSHLRPNPRIGVHDLGPFGSLAGLAFRRFGARRDRGGHLPVGGAIGDLAGQQRSLDTVEIVTAEPDVPDPNVDRNELDRLLDDHERIEHDTPDSVVIIRSRIGPLLHTPKLRRGCDRPEF